MADDFSMEIVSRNEYQKSIWARKLMECVSACVCAFVISRYRVSVGRCFILYFIIEVSKNQATRYVRMGRYINHQCKPLHKKKFNGKRVREMFLSLSLSIIMMIIIIIIIEAYPVRIILEVMLNANIWWRRVRSDRDTIMRYICAEEIGKWRLLDRKVPC